MASPLVQLKRWPELTSGFIGGNQPVFMRGMKTDTSLDINRFEAVQITLKLLI